MPPHDTSVIQFSLGRANAFIVRGKKPIIVDTGYPGSCPAIIAKLKQNGIDPKSVSLILITHGHADHFGSAADLKKQTGAPVAVHKLDAAALIKGEDPPLDPTGTPGRLLLSLMSKKGPAKAPPLQPDIIIEHELNLSKFGVDGHAVHTPGHTAGSVSVLLPGGRIIAGDTIMRGLIRFWQPHYPLFANNIFQLRESIKFILRQKPSKIYSGHGGPFTPKSVLRHFA
jgi:hydroxyacylglutathione hydrolase